MPSPPPAQSCTAVFAGGEFLLFDAGDNAARSMETLNLPITELSSIFLTHFHGGSDRPQLPQRAASGSDRLRAARTI